MIVVLHELVPECRLGVVAYRDLGSEYVTRRSALTDDRVATLDFVNAIAVGVGKNDAGVEDWPEAVGQGLADAIHSNWRRNARKAIIIIGDASARPEQADKALAMAADFRRRHKGVVHTIYVRTVSSDNMKATPLDPGETNEAKVKAHAYSNKIRGFFESMARSGGGEALELTEGDEVVRHLLTLAFGVQWTGNIQRIYDRAGVE